MTRLMQAVQDNQADRVRTLIAQGADVDELDANGDAPLIIAAYSGYTGILRLLLEAGADVSVVDPGMKATALHAAAYAGHAGAAKLLIEHGIDVDKQGPYNGYIALHDAVWQNNVETARVLVEAGASLDIRSHTGETPLEFAKSRNHTQIADLIERRIAANRAGTSQG